MIGNNEINSVDLSSKSFICFGDSITWYDGHPYTWGKEKGYNAVGFESYLREAGGTVHNEGISNATICEISSHIINTDIDSFDFVLITSGANDSRFNIPVGNLCSYGSEFDAKTFMGCLQNSIEYIRENNKIAKVLLMTPLRGWIYAPSGYAYPRNEDGVVEERYAEAILRTGSYYNCPVCDWFHEIELTEQNRIEMINDPEPDPVGSVNPNPLYSLHPSTKGYKAMAALLIRTILNA